MKTCAHMTPETLAPATVTCDVYESAWDTRAVETHRFCSRKCQKQDKRVDVCAVCERTVRLDGLPPLLSGVCCACYYAPMLKEGMSVFTSAAPHWTAVPHTVILAAGYTAYKTLPPIEVRGLVPIIRSNGVHFFIGRSSRGCLYPAVTVFLRSRLPQRAAFTFYCAFRHDANFRRTTRLSHDIAQLICRMVLASSSDPAWLDRTLRHFKK